jgi:formylmethanofuran dehydrogenase subunit E
MEDKMQDLPALLEACSARHDHLCPRQVLGVRMGLIGAQLLDLSLPRKEKSLLVITETDGCFVDGLEAAAGVSVGHRTLRVEDYGKVAATFVNLTTGEAIRLAPRSGIREHASEYAPGEKRPYFAQLTGYQRMPDSELFSATPVLLTSPVEQVISRPGVRTICSDCGEEIINEREIICDGKPYCRACIGEGYYHFVSWEPSRMCARRPVEDLADLPD